MAIRQQADQQPFNQSLLTHDDLLDLQGDEILTLCRISDYKSIYQFLSFLLRQAKGPLQYLITCSFSVLDPTFSSELTLRLPFAIANLLALVCFFILVQRLFTLQIAIYSTFLLATNGIIHDILSEELRNAHHTKYF